MSKPTDPIPDAPAPSRSRKPGSTAPVPQSGFKPLRELYRRYVLIGAGALGFGVLWPIFSGASYAWFMTSVLGAFGACFLALGIWGSRVGAAAPVLSTSLNLLQAGKLAEASALLETIEHKPVPGIAISCHIQRAMIALRVGDLGAAIEHSTAVVDAPPRLLFRSIHEVQRGSAFGMRAWARAAKGDLDLAMEDVALARKSGVPTPEALARASLAEAIVLEKRGDRAELGALLRRDRKLLLGGLDVRERAIVRAMQRMLKAPPRSVYRTAAELKPQEIDQEPTISEWLGRVAPELSAFAPRPGAPVSVGAVSAPAEPVPSKEAVAQVSEARRPAKSRKAWKVLALWAVLVTMFIAIWEFLQPAKYARPRLHAPPPPPPDPGGPLTLLWGVGLAALLVGMFVLLIRRNQAQTRTLHRLASAIATGDDVDDELAEAANSQQDLTAAQAELLRASVADRRGNLAQGIAHIDAARARLRTEGTQAAAAGMLAPALTGARAYMLAGLRRRDEALAELAHLPEDYLFLDRTRFVVRLVALLAEGDLEGAGLLVEATSPELSIGPRDELLRDLVRAATSPSGAGMIEIARLRDELRDDDESRRWIETVAPSLLARFHEATTSDALDERAGGDSEDERAGGDSEEDEAGDAADETGAIDAEAAAEEAAEAEAAAEKEANQAPRVRVL
ncbi:MAG: hypothetical protein R3F14_34210 [Polyangiaceae bacterium]